MAIDEVRRIAYNLRPPNLERLGVTAVIEELIEKASAVSGIQVSADIAPIDGCLSADAAINLYRILQESVNNVIRHALATKANVEIWREDGGLHVTVADNGRGFSVESGSCRGLGLTSIAERVKMLGGVHTIVSTPGQGTTLSIQVPAKRLKGAGHGV
jgi:signal transduction histidine kinase